MFSIKEYGSLFPGYGTDFMYEANLVLYELILGTYQFSVIYYHQHSWICRFSPRREMGWTTWLFQEIYTLSFNTNFSTKPLFSLHQIEKQNKKTN